MPIYKRGKTYWLDITQPNGQRLRQSAQTGNRRDAQQLHDQIKAQLWRQSALGERPAYQWQDAAAAWLNERGDYPSRSDDIIWLRWLHPHLYDTALTTLTVQRISEIQAIRQAEGVKARSVNAILQSFPEDYAFVAPDAPVRLKVVGRLIGNAVPVALGSAIAESISAHLRHYGLL